MTDNKNLKALCAAAPTGPWLVENDSLYFKDDGYTRHLLDADAGHDVEDGAYYAALNFIAAANPAAVQALIAENEAFEDGMRSLASNLGAGGYNAATLTAAQLIEKAQWGVSHQADASGRLADDLRAERDQLLVENEVLCEKVANINVSGFADVFYTVAEKLGITGARPVSPMQVFASEVLPALQSAIRDAERYRWIRDKSEAVHQFYLSVPLWFTGVRFRAEDVDKAIDAMSKGEQS